MFLSMPLEVLHVWPEPSVDVEVEWLCIECGEGAPVWCGFREFSGGDAYQQVIALGNDSP